MYNILANVFCIESAHAADMSAGVSDTVMSMLPLFLIVVVFYFLIIRPQQKKAREHKEMLNQVKKGHKVVTASGIFGNVSNILEDKVVIEVASGINITVKKESIAEIHLAQQVGGGAAVAGDSTADGKSVQKKEKTAVKKKKVSTKSRSSSTSGTRAKKKSSKSE